MAARPSVPPIDLEALSLDAFEDRPVAVLGLARSGVALGRFLLERGARVTLYDARPVNDLSEDVASLADAGALLVAGPDEDPADVLAGQALVCTSPSISSRYPTTEPRLRQALADIEGVGAPAVVSEVDLFLRLCPAATVGVTGTKGKTTTSSLIAAVLAEGPRPVLLGGNIGTPLIERVPGLTRDHLVVLELSELQLPTLSRGTDLAVYTHVTSDHLDRHGSLLAYRTVKRRLLELLPPAGVLVRNEDDPVVRTYAPPAGARTVGYSSRGPVHGGVGVADGAIVSEDMVGLTAGSRVDGSVLTLDEIPLPGAHNVANVAAAVSVGLLHGLSSMAIRAAVRGFAGVPNRLEIVAELDGVRYVNDSQGTQPDAVIAAVRAFPRPLVLIAGGRDKGNPIDALAAEVAARVSAAVLIGESADALERAFRAAGLTMIERAHAMPEAVRRASVLARAGSRGADAGAATVLLSPAAASFDMFRDYEARGEAFRAAVRGLEAGTRA